MTLPPLPKPPRRDRPITKSQVSLPPLPAAPVRPPSRPATKPGALPNLAQPRPARPPGNATTRPRLVTPAQAEAFYGEAFRELQVLERDLLERGPWRQAADRVRALDRDARELSQALGPSARSGDQDFAAALKKVTFVVEYLDRVLPLLDGPPVAREEPPPPEPPKHRGPLGRLFRRRSDDA
jgi:hypothetical protein